jgi:periplasmic protein TonB
MNNALADRLDEQITTLLAGVQPPAMLGDSWTRELLLMAEELRCQPRAAFGVQLGVELREQALRMQKTPRLAGTAEFVERPVVQEQATRATMFEPPQFESLNVGPVQRAHLAVSFALHVAALAGVLTSGLWVVEHGHEVGLQLVSVLTESPYILPPAKGEAHGGGGGGDRDKTSASKGTAPRFAREQLTPPTVIVRNETPKLPVDPTLVGPPDLLLPQSSQTGDPLANILSPPSNGAGTGGGIGSGHGGGIGVGNGPGIGPGDGGGIGGGVYHVGGGVSAPRPLYDPDPEYSEEARKAKYQGSVVLDVTVAADGRPRDLRVVRSLGMGLDERALEAVRRWRFDPAMKDGRPVAVRVSIEVAFRLY